MNLKNKKCIPCEDKKQKPLTREVAETFIVEVPTWTLDAHAKQISKEYTFLDFVKAMAFVDEVADVAEGEGHHPDIFISYNKVQLTLSTHSIGGLSENDFIVAAKIDGLWRTS